ncbi:MAG: helix-hairpin-helix domain-containing protein [Balneolaceae bacterium]
MNSNRVISAYMLWTAALSLAITFFLPSSGLALQTDTEIEQTIDEMGDKDSLPDLEDLVESLRQLAADPVNINRASMDELLQLPSINIRLARSIIHHRKNIKPFENTGELIQVKGIGQVTVSRLLPYVTAGEPAELRRILYTNPRFWTSGDRFEGFSRIQSVVQKQEAYRRGENSGGYVGSPVKYYQRFRYQSDHLSMNLTQEKDPGEKLAGLTRFDFNSWHISVRDLNRWKTVVVGDYSLRMGQGLILWNGTSFGKGRAVIRSVHKKEQGLRPYTSAQETDFFRGIAATYGNRIQITGFYSFRKLTASVVREDTIRFPSNYGYHRTLNELGRRFNTEQVTTGGRIRAELPNGFVGITGLINRFDRPVLKGTQPYQLYDFYGKVNSSFSADFRLATGPFLVYGEAGRSQNGGYGFISGTEIKVSEKTTGVLSYRNYGKRFQPVFGTAFGEQTLQPQNEYGFYAGLKHKLSESFQVSGYVDRFYFPAPRFLTRHPSRGNEWLILLEYQPGKQTEIYLQIRQKKRGEEYSTVDEFGEVERIPDESKRLNTRLHFSRQIHPKFRIRSRLEIVRSRPAATEPEIGFLVYQDFRYTPGDHLTVDARFTLFETEGFNSRVYQFENDLLYVLSNAMLFDHGQRFYLLISWQPADWLRLWFKASISIYSNRSRIGSGPTQIDGNRRSDLGFQARVRF